MGQAIARRSQYGNGNPGRGSGDRRFARRYGSQYSFGRLRPDQGEGLGNFFDGGVSFPSDHSAVAWSIASVIAHEYPGPFTQAAVYSLATAVSATRVMGKQHFPSDVVVGAAMGWLVGREVYRTRHDPSLAGEGWDPLSRMMRGDEQGDRHYMGSPFVPLDSWVYPALERLAGLRLIHTEIMGIQPWTRIECARLTEEAGEALQQDLRSISRKWPRGYRHCLLRNLPTRWLCWAEGATLRLTSIRSTRVRFLSAARRSPTAITLGKRWPTTSAISGPSNAGRTGEQARSFRCRGR